MLRLAYYRDSGFVKRVLERVEGTAVSVVALDLHRSDDEPPFKQQRVTVPTAVLRQVHLDTHGIINPWGGGPLQRLRDIGDQLYALREWIDWRWVFAICFLIFMYLMLIGVIDNPPVDPGNWNDPDPRHD